jgi:hypothetical protein
LTRATGGARSGFATQLNQGALEALALFAELGEALLDEIASLVEYV